MLDRIFSQNRTTSNYITLLLDRLGDAGEPFTGRFTISEPVAGFENITSQPKMNVEKVPGLTDADQHWQILTECVTFFLMDSFRLYSWSVSKDNGIIGPDGNIIPTDSIVPRAPDGQLVAVFGERLFSCSSPPYQHLKSVSADSGYTFPQVPRAVSDAIYGRVRGAQYDVKNQLWLVPCDQLLNISFNFGGVNYPIHPLDTVSADFNMTDSTGQPICVGTVCIFAFMRVLKRVLSLVCVTVPTYHFCV